MQNMMRWALLMGLLFSFVPHTQGQDFVQPQDTTRVAWHPDGRYLAVMSETQLDIVDTLNETIVNTYSNLDTIPFASPEWSPDGTQIVFVSDRNYDYSPVTDPWDIYLTNVSGSVENFVVNLPNIFHSSSPAS